MEERSVESKQVDTLEILVLHEKWHLIKEYEEGKSADGSYAMTYCGLWAHESWVEKLGKFPPEILTCKKCYKAFWKPQIFIKAGPVNEELW